MGTFLFTCTCVSVCELGLYLTTCFVCKLSLQAATITDAAGAVDTGQIGAAFAMAFLYVVRHGAVYYSLGKWVLEWNRQLFDGSDGVNS